MSQYQTELQVALAAVRDAARVCQSVQSSITAEVLEKRDRSPVTIADFASQAVVCRVLEAAFRADPVIGEEDSAELQSSEQAAFVTRIQSELQNIGIEGTTDQLFAWIDRGGAQDYSNRFWTLDPIDGTKGFLRGGQYAVALALLVDGRIDLAVLGCPNLEADGATGCLMYAVRGQGSWSVPLDESGPPQRVSVTETHDMSAARLCESVESGHSSHDRSAAIAEYLGITREPVRLDSQAKYATVARGDADVYLRLPTRANYNEKIWDHAGGVLIVEEAGGTVTDVNGAPLDFTHGRELRANSGVVVTNGPLHEPVIAALRAVN